MDTYFTGHDPQTNRELRLYRLASTADVAAGLNDSRGHFVAMLAWDASNATDEEITALSRNLIDAGCAYLCCWGNDCERVHDLFDSEWVANGFDESDDTIMTTWHADDTLDEFIYFSLALTEPTQKYRRDCRSVVAFVIDDTATASTIQDAFANPSQVYAENDG